MDEAWQLWAGGGVQRRVGGPLSFADMDSRAPWIQSVTLSARDISLQPLPRCSPSI